MILHPDCEAYLEAMERWREKTSIQSWGDIGADRARAMFSELTLSRMPKLPEMDLVEDYEIEGRAGPRRLRILRPRGAGTRPLPVALYFHGGGYVLGGIEESEDEARRIAANTPALVISASYRLGPDHPFPAAIDDAYDALLWAAHHAASFGGDPRRLMVGGTSSGAGLAAAISRLAATENGPRIALTYLLCPWLDMTMSQHSVLDYGEGYGQDRVDLEWFRQCYLGPDEAPDHPLASPILHPIPARLPKTFVLAAECDPLRDEARVYARMLKEAKVPVTYVMAPGMIHAFNALIHLIPGGLPQMAAIDEALRAI
jgi:acetyl esterase